MNKFFWFNLVSLFWAYPGLAQGIEGSSEGVKGAFGVTLGASMETLPPINFVRQKYDGGYIKFRRDDKGSLLSRQVIEATPITGTIVKISGMHLYETADLSVCKRDRSLISDTLEQKYKSIKRTDFYQNEDKLWSIVTYRDHDDSEDSGLGRTIELSCNVFCEGILKDRAFFVVEYRESPFILKRAWVELMEVRRKSKESSPDKLRDRGLDPDAL